MASPGNEQCANCIGTLSFPITVYESIQKSSARSGRRARERDTLKRAA